MNSTRTTSVAIALSLMLGTTTTSATSVIADAPPTYANGTTFTLEVERKRWKKPTKRSSTERKFIGMNGALYDFGDLYMTRDMAWMRKSSGKTKTPRVFIKFPLRHGDTWTWQETSAAGKGCDSFTDKWTAKVDDKITTTTIGGKQYQGVWVRHRAISTSPKCSEATVERNYLYVPEIGFSAEWSFRRSVGGKPNVTYSANKGRLVRFTIP